MMCKHRGHRGLKSLRGICVFTALALLLCACGQTGQQDDIVLLEKDEEGVTFAFGVAQIGEVVKTSRVPCTYRQAGEEEITFQLGGRIVDRVYVEDGDQVKKGQLLVELSSQDLERSIEDLEYRIARNELLLGYADVDESIEISRYYVNALNLPGITGEEVQKQVEKTQQDYQYKREDISDALAADRQEVEMLRQDLRKSRVYASMDGVVYDLRFDLRGSTSQTGEVIMRVLDTSETFFETSIPNPEKYFSEGDMISMTISYGRGHGEYILIPWHMEEWGETQLFEVYDFPEGAILEVGDSGTIPVVEERKENVLTVPIGALYNAQDKQYVYVLGADNLREVRWVETGMYGDSVVEIKSGLTEGERVILK